MCALCASLSSHARMRHTDALTNRRPTRVSPLVFLPLTLPSHSPRLSSSYTTCVPAMPALYAGAARAICRAALAFAERV
jgi:hypothetical protein